MKISRALFCWRFRHSALQAHLMCY